MTNKRTILIEFNELCPTLLDRFIAQGYLPHFKRFRDESTTFVTDCSEDEPNLEPWIQWVTVHSGMPFAEHGVFRLGDGKKLTSKLVGQCLAEAGIPVGICSSMNTNYRAMNGGYVLPDPWAASKPYPDRLLPFYEVVHRQVQESSREGGGLTGIQALSFLGFMLRNGLSMETSRAIVSQLLAERRDPGVRWHRAALLDRLQYDVFRSLNKRLGVRFATFFANSTAHYQHYFWRNMEPGVFAAPPSETDHPSLATAVLQGYKDMDRLVGKFIRDYGDALLILCTALSQQPWTDTQKVTFRPRDFREFLEFAGIDIRSVSVEPVMAEQFHLVCSSPDEAQRVYSLLKGLTVDGRVMMFARLEGANVFAGCWIADTSAEGKLVRRESDGKEREFNGLFYRIHTVRSGKHHPDGVLWFRNHSPRTTTEKVQLTAIAPTILSYFGVTPPSTMREAPLEI